MKLAGTLILLMLLTLSIIIALIIFGPSLSMNTQGRRARVLQTASDYLNEKYEEEMVIISINAFSGPFSDAFYHVNYHRISDPDTVFLLRVRWNGYDVLDDNFFNVILENQVDDVFRDYIRSIWGEETVFRVHLTQGRIEAIYPDINERTRFEDVKHLFAEFSRYNFSIRPSIVLSDTNKYEEAQKVLDFFEIIKEKGHSPGWIALSYLNPNQTDGDGLSIFFRRWKEITTDEQVLSYFDAIID